MLVYKVTNDISGKSYVGLTSRSVKQRWAEHKRAAKQGSTLPLHYAIRKYGHDNFGIEILEECFDTEHLREREQYWIKTLGTFGSGYNATIGGDGSPGCVLSEKHKRILSEVHCNNQHAKGYRHTDEAKAKIGKASQLRDAIGSKTRGKKLTKDQIDKSRRGHFKAVVQCDNDWNALKYYEGISVAAKFFMPDNIKSAKSGIGRAIRQPRRTAFGCHWRFITCDEKLTSVLITE